VILLEARLKQSLVGWVTLRTNQSTLTAHWATLSRLQSHPAHRGLGIGRALLSAAVEHARGLGLEHLRLALRGGEGLESYYEQHRWVEFGRHRNALRLSSGDDRDEVFMSVVL
jgi:GNAT superfamily N-acetyltransferase